MHFECRLDDASSVKDPESPGLVELFGGFEVFDFSGLKGEVGDCLGGSPKIPPLR